MLLFYAILIKVEVVYLKEAMWGVGLILLAVFGIFLISLFGNITVTNQQDYTAMKNAVEAAMYDAIDLGRYRAGFCLCTDKTKSTNDKWVFDSSSQYEISDLVDNACDLKAGYECEIIEGEYIIDKKVFAESLVRRFAESIKGNNDYQIIIDDVIEYPPKVSVSVRSTNSYEAGGGDNYNIDNHIDAILEMDRVKAKLSTSEQSYYNNDNNYDGDDGCVVTSIYTSGSIKYYVSSSGYVCKTELIEGTNPGPGGGGCFLAGTMIAVEGGYKDISKMEAGDKVLTFNKEKNINEYKRITYVFEYKNMEENLYTIETDDTEFSLTSEHNVYVKRNNEYKYVAAKDLKIGDIVRYSDNTYHIIKEIVYKPIVDTVYNLEVDDNLNFYVGDKEILVHSETRTEKIDDETHGDANGGK